MVLRAIWLCFLPQGVVWHNFSMFKGCLDFFLQFMAFLWPSCDRFCGMICECLWHVQISVSGLFGLKI